MRGAWTVSRVVRTIFIVIVALLLIRFFLVIIGVNTSAAAISWFFTLTGALAAPFRALLTWVHDVHYGRVLVEWTILLAAIAYAIIGAVLAWILRRFGV